MLPVFDGHNDALTRSDHAGIATGRPEGHLDLPRMREGGVRAGIFAICAPSRDENWTPLPRQDGVIEFELAAEVPHTEAAAFAAAVAGRLDGLERAGEVRIVRTSGDLDAVHGDPEGPPGAVLHLEGAEAIDAELESLGHWHAAGLRSLGPVWSRPNAFGHGVPFISPSSPDTGLGLTEAGHALVRSCAELGIVVDLAHLNEAGFWDVSRAELGPLVCSHAAVHALCPTTRNLTDRQLDAVGESQGLVGIVFAPPFLREDFADDPDTPLALVAEHAAYVAERIGVEHVALCPTTRNLTDRQLDAIGESQGLVGIVFAPPFLREDFADDPDTPLALVAEHAAYVAERIGVEHVALGSDYDGATIPAELGDVAGTPKLVAALRATGFSESELEAITWGNWRRVLGAWWD